MDMDQRATEIMKIFKQLNAINLGIAGFEEFQEFKKICNCFIRDGNPRCGNIEIYGTKRIICYRFGEQVECFLKYDETV
tara:strand:+ start:96 stop:332 length:237 start_codon:yes stop_codon:yes gene_type:complete